MTELNKKSKARFFTQQKQEFNELTNLAIHDRYFLAAVLTSISSVFISTGFIMLLYKRLPFEIPLMYSLTFGEDQLSNKLFIFLLPGSTMFLAIINLFLASKIYTFAKVGSYVLATGTIAISFLSLISVIAITIIMT